jgi:hypothetical protein
MSYFQFSHKTGRGWVDMDGLLLCLHKQDSEMSAEPLASWEWSKLQETASFGAAD